ncbi:hypothetical protein ABEB36_014120 [Hypothenemus hampei]|uniref:Uncharacterized protein n=2 Tax=Hypothenemus hampei TaxID=57062 RepID=A0ABD1E3C9_HYPHA
MDGNVAGANGGGHNGTSTLDDSEETSWNCSVHPSVFFLLGTLVLTTCATGMLCAAIMTDHWEEVTWDIDRLDSLANGTIRLQSLLDRVVIRVSTNDLQDRTIAFLVPIHGGIWTLCLSLTDEEIDLLGRVDFPPVPTCVNYLSGASEIAGIKGSGYEPSADWQHRKSNMRYLSINKRLLYGYVKKGRQNMFGSDAAL